MSKESVMFEKLKYSINKEGMVKTHLKKAIVEALHLGKRPVGQRELMATIYPGERRIVLELPEDFAKRKRVVF